MRMTIVGRRRGRASIIRARHHRSHQVRTASTRAVLSSAPRLPVVAQPAQRMSLLSIVVSGPIRRHRPLNRRRQRQWRPFVLTSRRCHNPYKHIKLKAKSMIYKRQFQGKAYSPTHISQRALSRAAFNEISTSGRRLPKSVTPVQPLIRLLYQIDLWSWGTPQTPLIRFAIPCML